METRSRQLGALALVFVVLLSGCMSMSVETTVSTDGTIDQQVVEIEFSDGIYGLIQQDAEQEGFDSVEEFLLDDIDTGPWGSVTSDETDIDGGVLLTITLTDGDPSEMDDIQVSVEEDTITFTETEFAAADEGDGSDAEFDDEFSDIDEAIASGVDIEYTVHMPGEVTETNGEIQEDGESVVWDVNDLGEGETLEATSDRPGTIENMPGFGVVLAGLSILLAAGFAIARNNTH